MSLTLLCPSVSPYVDLSACQLIGFFDDIRKLICVSLFISRCHFSELKVL